jgi:hypothetical protein
MNGQQPARKLQSEKPASKSFTPAANSAEIAGQEIRLQAGENFVQKPFRPGDLRKSCAVVWIFEAIERMKQPSPPRIAINFSVAKTNNISTINSADYVLTMQFLFDKWQKLVSLTLLKRYTSSYENESIFFGPAAGGDPPPVSGDRVVRRDLVWFRQFCAGG